MARSLETAAWDEFVRVAHDEPVVAIRALCRNPELCAVRSSWGETALEAASHLGHRHLIGALLDSGSTLDVFAACALGMKRAALKLLDGVPRGALGVHRLPILHFGIASRDVEMVDALLQAGIEVNPCGAGLPPLHSAVGAGSLSIVHRLLAAGADVNATDIFGATALDWAIELGDGANPVTTLLRVTASERESLQAKAI